MDLTTLNEQQRKAVTTTDGAVLVLAGAGSGKTKALTYRIGYILGTGLAGPSNILALTFTNKAAGEMKERISLLLESSDFDSTGVKNIPWMGTFHSICLKILKMDGAAIGLSRNFTIYDSDEQQLATKEAMERAGRSTKDFNPRAIHSYISSAKNELVTPEQYAQYAQGYFQEVVAEVYPEYQNVLKENNALDFDDLLTKAVYLFQDNPQVLSKYQNMFRYILVDEYQDTNHAQYILVKMFAQKYKNICVVGDDDQSIYAFRGATIRNILNFEKDYPEAEVIKLEQNYRSTKKILEASYQVISKNQSRKDKKLWTENQEGESITIYEAGSETDEASWVLEKIGELSKNINLSEIAILYRTNAQSRNMEEAFLRSNIPYKIVGGIRFYDRKEIKDVMAYLKLVYNNSDTQSLSRIINVPKRGIGAKTLDNFLDGYRSQTDSLIDFMSFASDESVGIKKFYSIIRNLIDASKKLNIVDLINFLLEETGYLKMLDDRTLENQARIENLKELISVASRFESEEPEVGLEKFLEEVSLLEGNSQEDDAVERVTLMTVHAAKGLEFKVVFVVGMEENLFPHSSSMASQKDLEEERRLAYVAITRAKEKLFMSYAVSRIYLGSKQNNPSSRFLLDIDESLVERLSSKHGSSVWDDFELEEEQYVRPDIKVGDTVRHEVFGRGEIIFLDDEVVRVSFGPAYGVKELMLEYAKLEKL